MDKSIAIDLQGLGPETSPRVQFTRNVEEITSLLQSQRVYAIPVLGYLEPSSFSQTRWCVAGGPGSGGLLLQVDGRVEASLYLQGDVPALGAILSKVTPARHGYITFEAQHRELVSRYFFLKGAQRLLRMHVDGDTFKDVTSTAAPLGSADHPAVSRLYRSDSAGYVGLRTLAEDTYYGVWQADKLVSIAGGHVTSTSHNGSAVVANVLTHADHRGRGYATQCVGAVTRALLHRVKDVVLNVDPSNTPALQAYRRLGYQEVGRLEEAWAFWKGHTLFDRALALLYRCVLGW